MEVSSRRPEAGATERLAIAGEIVAEYLSPFVGRCAYLTGLIELFRSQRRIGGRRKFGHGLIHGRDCAEAIDLVIEAGRIDLLEFHLFLAVKERNACRWENCRL